MRKLLLRTITLGLSAVLTVQACSTATKGPVSTSQSPASPTAGYPAAATPTTVSTPATSSAEAQGEAAAIARAKADSLRHPYTAAGINFMSHMIGHHAQAIVMAKWAPTQGASPSVQTLAGRIINAQQDEINIMQTWLRDRQLPVPSEWPEPIAQEVARGTPKELHEVVESDRPPRLVRLGDPPDDERRLGFGACTLSPPRAAELVRVAEDAGVALEVLRVEGL